MKNLGEQWRSLIVSASLCLALTAQAEITNGVPREQVIRELGEPTGKMAYGNRETLIYPHGKEISLKNGRVEQVIVHPPPPTNAPSAILPAANDSKPHKKTTVTKDKAAPKEKEKEYEDGHAVVTLVDGKQVEVMTKTMYIFHGLTTSLTHTLDLPNGLRIPFKQMKSITIEPAADKSFVTIHVKKLSGAEVSDKAKEPWINIVGDNAVGRFSKPVTEIKSIEFAP